MKLEDFLESNDLRDARIGRNFRQWHLHLMSGVGLPRISQIEHGAPATVVEKEKIAKALGMSVDSIWPSGKGGRHDCAKKAVGN